MGKRLPNSIIATVPIGYQDADQSTRNKVRNGRSDNMYLCLAISGTVLAVLATAISVYLIISVHRQEDGITENELDAAIWSIKINSEYDHKEMKSRIKQLEAINKETETVLKSQAETIYNLTATTKHDHKKLEEMTNRIQQQEAETQGTVTILKYLEETIHNFTATSEHDHNEMTNRIQQLEAVNQDTETILKSQAETMYNLTATTEHDNNKVKEMTNRIQHLEAEDQGIVTILKYLRETIHNLTATSEYDHNQMKEMTNRIQQLEAINQDTETILKSQTETIYNLTATLTEIQLDCITCNKSANSSDLQGTCPSEFTWFQNHCYKIFEAAITWAQAKEQCKAQNSDLVAIENEQTMQFLIELISKISITEPFWIGGSDIQTEGRYVWTDRYGNTRPISGYTSWSSGEPNNVGDEDCIWLSPALQWKWNDVECSKRIGYICQDMEIY